MTEVTGGESCEYADADPLPAQCLDPCTCDDSDVCTDDYCGSDGSCRFVEDPTNDPSCTDPPVCPLTCDEGNVCTDDACVWNVGTSEAECQFTENGQCTDAECGDGNLDAGEECDDGNTDDNEGCSS